MRIDLIDLSFLTFRCGMPNTIAAESFNYGAEIEWCNINVLLRTWLLPNRQR